MTVEIEYYNHLWIGAVFHTKIEAGGEVVEFYPHVRLTRRQVRRLRREMRNYTLPVFDRFGPDPLDRNMHRMKGARQAYQRRKEKGITWGHL